MVFWRITLHGIYIYIKCSAPKGQRNMFNNAYNCLQCVLLHYLAEKLIRRVQKFFFQDLNLKLGL